MYLCDHIRLIDLIKYARFAMPICKIFQKTEKYSKSVYTTTKKYDTIEEYSNTLLYKSAILNFMLINLHRIIYFLLSVNNMYIGY